MNMGPHGAVEKSLKRVTVFVWVGIVKYAADKGRSIQTLNGLPAWAIPRSKKINLQLSTQEHPAKQIFV